MVQQILYRLQTDRKYLQAELLTQPIMYYPYDTKDPLGTHNYPLALQLSPNGRAYFWEGISIISKFPVIETGTLFHSIPPQCKDTNKRATQYIKVLYQNKPLYVFNVHYSTRGCARTQLKETIDYFNRIVHAQPLLVMGDFNATPENKAYDYFRAYGLTDVWQKLRPRDVGYTSPTDKPIKRIDYIWTSHHFNKDIKNSNQIQLVGKEAKGDIYASDHLGLTLTLG